METSHTRSELAIHENLLLAFDPGSSNTGIALFKFSSMTPIFKRVIKDGAEGLMQFFREMSEPGKIAQIVCEDYTLLPYKKHGSTSSGTIEVIGRIKFWAEMHKVPIEMQEPFKKDSGARFTGIGTQYIGPNKHMPDHLSAMNHGAYWLVTNKHVANPAAERLRRFTRAQAND